MAYSRKLRVASPDEALATGRGVNDNVPGLMPGHQLSELDGVPRQPPAESVVHYARIAEIGSFPDSADAGRERQPDMAPALEELPERQRASMSQPAARGATAGLFSCLAHAAVFSLLAFTMVAVPEDPVEEAGSVVSVTMLGENEFDQLAAGEPDIVQAEDVTPETLSPSEPEPVTAQPVEAVTATPVQPELAPVEAAQPSAVTPMAPQPETPAVTPPEPMVSQAPQALTAIVPAEPVVAQAAPVVMPATPVEAVAPSAVTPLPPQETPPPVAEKPVEPPVAKPPEQQPEAQKPEPKKPEPQKPEPKKPVAREKPVEKPKPKKPAPKRAGAKGDAAEDRKRGSADGSQEANANRDGARDAGRNTNGAGSAAVANYPGKVQSKIRRSVRVPSAFRREKASLSVRVRLTIGSSGQLSGVSVARSSGVGELDEAVINGVRRAAPFPPLPPEWGKPSWTFTQEVQVTGR